MLAQERLESGLRRSRRLRRPRRAARPRGPGTARNSWARTARRTIRPLLERGDRPSGRVGAGLDPCAALQTTIELPPGGRAEVVFFLGQAATVDEARALVTRYRDLDLDLVLQGRHDPVGRHRRRGPGQDARPLDGPDAQSLAALPDAGLSRLGALRLLPGGRRLRIPRPAPGRDGPDGGRARARARAPPARRGPAVRGGRRPALVASALRARRPHPHLRRLRLAAVRRRALRGGHRRRGGARRGRPLPRRAGPRGGPGRRLLPADGLRGARHALRALRPRPRPEPRRRRARPAADRRGGLERWHEPGRPRGPRRERLARVVPAHDAVGVRARWRRRAASTRAPTTWRAHVARAQDRARAARRGTATGIAAPISTTGRRSAPPRTRNAASTRSPSRGR